MEADREEQMTGEGLGDNVSSMGLCCVVMKDFLCRIDGEREPGTMEKC